MSDPGAASPIPLFRVVRGRPTEDEIAALCVVFAGLAAEPEAAEPRPSGWSAYWRSVRAPLQPGPGAWRAAGRN